MTHTLLRQGARSRVLRTTTAIFAVSVLVGGCTWIDRQLEGTWFDFSEDQSTQTSQLSSEAAGVGQNEEFPNLATVPAEAPETSTAQEREQVAEGLAADQANAQYADENLVAQPDSDSAAAPPVPEMAQIPEEQGMATPPTPSGATGTQLAAGNSFAPSGADWQAFAGMPADAGGTQTAALPPQMGPIESASGTGQRVGQPAALIYFGHGSAGLNGQARQVLRDIAQLYREHGGTVRVVGHASQRTRTVDPTNHQLANFNVSLSRAGIVAGELIRLGVKPDQVQIAGLAAEEPVYNEFMPTGEAGNRRAEIYLEY